MTIRPLIPGIARTGRIVVGMVHLRPLPGSPAYGGSLGDVHQRALRDAEVLAAGGVDAVMIENFGDVPFYPDRVPAVTVAHITAIAGEIRARFPQLPLGINVLRNDGRSALAVASAVGASFIRVNVLCAARVTDQGIIQGIAHELMRERAMLGAQEIRVWADVDVKHSASLAPRALEEEVHDTIERGLADAIIVSGSGTGRPTDLEQVRRAKRAAGATPVVVGSGVTSETIAAFFETCDAVIVGTAIKADGRPTGPVDPQRLTALMHAARNSAGKS